MAEKPAPFLPIEPSVKILIVDKRVEDVETDDAAKIACG
jgi:hypothetical protein